MKNIIIISLVIFTSFFALSQDNVNIRIEKDYIKLIKKQSGGKSVDIDSIRISNPIKNYIVFIDSVNLVFITHNTFGFTTSICNLAILNYKICEDSFEFVSRKFIDSRNLIY
jgi:energy-converting hydrogenase Eha subunit H